jgi:hypothetical protein
MIDPLTPGFQYKLVREINKRSCRECFFYEESTGNCNFPKGIETECRETNSIYKRVVLEKQAKLKLKL